jgi:hypothetical protein
LVAGPFHDNFEQENGCEKTEIHSKMGRVDLKDLPDPQRIGRVRYEDDNNENKIEQ